MSTIPEYGEWLPDVWDAYLRDLVGYDRVDHYARLPATFRWHEFHRRLAIAAGSRKGRDVKQARCEASQSGPEGASPNLQGSNP